jgi:3-deoxy-manno-octulosonate cytidylyltransferase (CMP-KDO synthetase)
VTAASGRVLGVVPARLASQRLPGKPLHLIAGRPLIAWVWESVAKLDALNACVIATDSEPVAETCRQLGAPVVMTALTHTSGTDRVAEVAEREEFQDYGIVVNIQGDEPFVTSEQVGTAIDQVRQGCDIGTIATPVRSMEAWTDPGVVKVARRSDGAALYFSRAPIPWKRDGTPDARELASEAYLRHVGVYAFTRQALRSWTALPTGELEDIERLEQLRPLAAGLRIGVGIVRQAEGGIDTPEDVRRVEARLQTLGYGKTQTSAEA